MVWVIQALMILGISTNVIAGIVWAFQIEHKVDDTSELVFHVYITAILVPFLLTFMFIFKDWINKLASWVYGLFNKKHVVTEEGTP